MPPNDLVGPVSLGPRLDRIVFAAALQGFMCLRPTTVCRTAHDAQQRALVSQILLYDSSACQLSGSERQLIGEPFLAVEPTTGGDSPRNAATARGRTEGTVFVRCACLRTHIAIIASYLAVCGFGREFQRVAFLVLPLS